VFNIYKTKNIYIYIYILKKKKKKKKNKKKKKKKKKKNNFIINAILLNYNNSSNLFKFYIFYS